MTTRAPDREHHVVLYGATGFTGRLVAEHLAEHHATASLRWAIAGRDESRLFALRDDLRRRFPHLDALDVIVADSRDPESLDRLVASSAVVCTTVGPYARLGEPLVAACVRRGTDYVDLTGEPQFVRRTIDRHHDVAAAGGVRIVHCCGFDSIPSDLGTFALQDAVIARDGRPCDEVKFLLQDIRGGVSGGTIASMVELLEDARDPGVAELVYDPYGLNPEGARHGPDTSDQVGVLRDPVTRTWTGPFVMAPVNTRVVRRTNALLGARYGPEFRYSEVVDTGSGPTGAVRATLLAAGLAGFRAAMHFGPTRALLRRFVLPSPGEGPDRRSIESGHFTARLSGRRDGHEIARVTVHAHRDPGYGATAIMLAESALCLATMPRDHAPGPPGVVTPACAMGSALIERLAQHGVGFVVQD